MKNQVRTFGLGGLVAGLAVAAALVVSAGPGNACGDKANKATAQKASSSQVETVSNAGGCGSQATAASNNSSSKMTAAGAGCGAKATMAAGSCGSKATQASADCATACAAKMSTADAKLPEDAKMTRLDVPGGIDMVFTSKNLNGVESFLNAHMNVCGDAKSNCDLKTSMTRVESTVVLSIRGEKADECCVGVVTTAAAAEKDEKATVKKS